MYRVDMIKIFLAIMLCVQLQINISNADTFSVGGANGWGFNMNGWPNGKIFDVGDVVEFKYKIGMHNVVIVNKVGFNSCNATGGEVLSSGDDQVLVPKGTTYFICSIGDHCANGVKVAIIGK
ncbi:basic blue protein-like [Lycium barbarum]|uniref:basic blue protein-like n=1 Tax=Lycium barbarum TaxID=112863 RepID=UPI00293E0806|nr:basic blue protein-like [Lycium barbarum]